MPTDQIYLRRAAPSASSVLLTMFVCIFTTAEISTVKLVTGLDKLLLFVARHTTFLKTYKEV